MYYYYSTTLGLTKNMDGFYFELLNPVFVSSGFTSVVRPTEANGEVVAVNCRKCSYSITEQVYSKILFDYKTHLIVHTTKLINREAPILWNL